MRLLALVSLVTFVLDQALKWLVVQRLDLKTLGEMDVFAPYLVLRMAWNRGVNFGLFASHEDAVRWALIALALVICGWVVAWLWRKGGSRMGMISGGLLVGGALGNVVDRVIYGAVADFLNMSCCGIENPYAFNVADIAIFVGAFGLVLFGPNSAAAPPKARKTP